MDNIECNTGQKRSKNFKESEIILLLELVSEVKDVLESKKSDHVALKEKDKVWRNLEKNFNIRSEVFYRDWKTLKVKYENLKKSSKKKLAQDRRYVLGTGGGPYKPPIITQTDKKVKEIIGELPVFGIPSQFDNDAQAVSVINMKKNPVICMKEVGLDVPAANEVSDNEAWSDVILHADSGNDHVDHSNIKNERSCQGASPSNTVTNQPFLPPRQIPEASVSGSLITNGNDSTTPDKPCDFGKKFSIAQLRSQKSSPLFIRKKKRSVMDSSNVGQKNEMVSKAKEELIEIQKKMYEEQIKMQKEEHEMKMNLLREEHRLLKLKIKSEELKIEKQLKEHQ